jgi:uncharacterized membrane protein YedE/YeeE
MAQVWLGLLTGVVFGFIIQRVGATDPDKMARAHLMLEGDIPKFMLLAGMLSAVGVWGLGSVGVGRTMPLPTSIVATGLAAIIFGIGWGISGYCPGTCWAAAGEGRMDALFALLGGLFGTLVFGQLHETLIPLLYLPTSQGPITLAQWFGSETAGLLVLLMLFGGGIWAIGRFWGYDR